MRDLLAYAFHRGEALAYRNAGMHDKYISHTRRARYYRSRFGTIPLPDDSESGKDVVMADHREDLYLDWGEDSSAAYEDADKTHQTAEITTWTKLNEGTSAYLFCTDDTVAKIFKARTIRPHQQEDGFEEDKELDEAKSEDAARQANIEREASVRKEVSIMQSVKGSRLVPRFFAYVAYFSKRNEHETEKVIIGYTMERIGDKSLLSRMRKKIDDETQRELVRVIKGVCKSVTCLDIKPSNFAITEEGEIRMIDLGDDYCRVVNSHDEDEHRDENENENEYYNARVLFCILIFCTSVCTKECNGTKERSTDLIPSLLVLIAELMPVRTEDGADESKTYSAKARVNIDLFKKTIDNDARYRNENVQANIARGECTRIISTSSKIDRRSRALIREGTEFLPSTLLFVFAAYLDTLETLKRKREVGD